MTRKITELDEGMARVGLTTKYANIANAKTMTSEMLAREGFTQRRQVRKGGMARVGLPANHANIANHESLDPGILGARRF